MALQREAGEYRVLTHERTPPQNADLEMCVLGAIMLEPKEAYPIAADYLTRDSFYLDGHGVIFELMGELHARGIPPDSIALLDELRARGLLEKVGGGGVVMGMLNSVPTGASVEYHARKVADKYKLRTLIRACSEVVDEAYRQEREPQEICDIAAEAMHALAASGAARLVVPVGEVLGEYMRELGARAEAAEAGQPIARGVPTGFPTLDRLIKGGPKRGEVMIVAAKTSGGKSVWSQQVAYACAHYNRTPVAIFSMEMSKEDITERLLVMSSKHTDPATMTLNCINSYQLEEARLNADEWAQLHEAFERVHAAPIHIVDSGTQTLASIRSQLSALIRKQGVQLAIIDYLQIMTAPPGTPEKRYEEVTALSRGVKKLARDLKIPIILLSQLKRVDDREPKLSDLRESGQIEQDADIVLLIHPLPYTAEDESYGRMPEVKFIVAKQRNGKAAWMKMYFYKDGLMFLEQARGMTLARR